MNDVIGFILIISLLVSALLCSFFIRNASLRQKKKYSHKFNIDIRDEDMTKKIVFSILGENFAITKNVIDIKQKCSWQEFQYSILTVTGRLSKKIDTVYLPYKFSSYRVLSNKLCLGKSNALPSDKVLKFLKNNNLSLDSGDWGALLIKNTGTFNSEDVDLIMDEFLSLIIGK